MSVLFMFFAVFQRELSKSLPKSTIETYFTAHYNPAVTVAVKLSGRNVITPLDAILYIVVQFVAGTFGALNAYWLTDKAPNVQIADIRKGTIECDEFL